MVSKKMKTVIAVGALVIGGYFVYKAITGASMFPARFYQNYVPGVPSGIPSQYVGTSGTKVF